MYIKEHVDVVFFCFFFFVFFFVFLIYIKRLDISFLSILNSKTHFVCYIMDISHVPNWPETFKFPQRSFGVKNPVKNASRHHGFR